MLGFGPLSRYPVSSLEITELVEVTGVRAELRLGDVGVRADQRVDITGQRLTLNTGEVSVHGNADTVPDSVRMTVVLGDVTVMTEQIVRITGTTLTFRTGDAYVRIRGDAETVIQGVRATLRVGPVRVWGQVHAPVAQEWKPIIEQPYMVDVVDTPGGVPVAALPIAGVYQQRYAQQEGGWNNIATKSSKEQIWRHIAA